MADTPPGFSRPSFDELLQRAQADYTAATGVDVLVRRGVIPEMPHMDARALHDLHGHLDYNALQGHPLFASGSWLEGWGRVWGVTRRAASKAVGDVNLTGTDGSVVAVDTVLTRADGGRYVVTTGGVIAGGVLTVAVAAETAAAAGNADAGVALNLESPIAAVDGTAVVGVGALTGGADVEKDDVFRARMLTRIQQPPHGGNVSDYSAWVLSVSGVTRVWVAAQQMGVGTVAIRFTMDDTYADGIPLPADVMAVQGVVDSVKPVTAEILVSAPSAVALDVTITGLAPDTPDIRAAISVELADMILRRGEPGVTVRTSWIWEAVSLAAGEDSHVISVPAADVVYAVGEIPVLGVVSYA